jgi:hypothetical protein
MPPPPDQAVIWVTVPSGLPGQGTPPRVVKVCLNGMDLTPLLVLLAGLGLGWPEGRDLKRPEYLGHTGELVTHLVPTEEAL